MGFLFKDEQLERDEEQRKALRKGTAPDATVGDVGKSVKASVYDTGAMVNAGLRASAGTDSFGKRAAFRERRDALKSEAVTQSMTPGGRAMAKLSVLPNEDGYSALDNPIGFIAFNGPKQLPVLAVSAIPGVAITRGVVAVARGAIAARGANAVAGASAALTGGSLNAGDVMHHVFGEIDKMTVKDWSKHQPYLDLVSKGMNSKQAIDKLTTDIVAKTFPAAVGIGIALNSFGVGQTLVKAGAGTLVKKGLGRGAAEGLVKESGQEFLEEGSGDAIAQLATNFDENFNWVQTLDAALTGGAVGGPVGGVVGGVANIGKPKTPKIPIAPPKAPDPAQTAAAGSVPLPPTPPPQTPPPTTATPPGPPVVNSGAPSPPPGAKRPRKDFKKKADPAEVAVVQAPTISAEQDAALQSSVPRPPPQAPPEPIMPPPPMPPPVAPPVAPPPMQQVTQGVTPEPLIRQRAQAAVVPPPQQATPLPPLEPIPPAPVEVVPPESMAGRILPDLAAKAEFQRQVEAPSQGTRYELGQNEEEVNDFRKHQAWRRKMALDVKSADATPIEKEAASIIGRRGIKLRPEQKARLKELHGAWIQEQQAAPKPEFKPEVRKEDDQPVKGQRGKLGIYDQEVESADDFLKVIARANTGTDKETPSQTAERIESIIDVLADAPQRADIAKAIVNSPYVNTVIGVASKIRDGSITDKDMEFFRAVEKDFVAQTQEELDAETVNIQKKSLGGFDAEASLVVESTPVQGTFGKASEGRKIETTAEEKAAILARYSKAPKGKEDGVETSSARQPLQDAGPDSRKDPGPRLAPAEQKLPTSVTPVPTSKPVPKTPDPMGKLKPKKKVIAKLASRAEQMSQAGQDLLELRRDVRAAVRGGDPNTEKLLQAVKKFQEEIRINFGTNAHNRIISDVDKLLSNEGMAPMRSLSVDNVISKLLRKSEPEPTVIYRDKDGVAHEAVRYVSVSKLFAELDKNGFDQLIAGSAITKAAMDMMVPRLLKLAGDVKVIVLKSDASVFETPSFRAAGMYDSENNIIVLDENIFSFDNRHDKPGWAAHVVMHEVAHAAFWHAARDNPRTSKLLEYFRQGVEDMINPQELKAMGVSYGITNIDELIAETWSNPKFRGFLTEIEIPAELARKIGLSRFKKYSAWSAFVEIVRKAFGFAPGTNTGLEFVLAATNQMSSTRLDADTETYWKNINDDIFDLPDMPALPSAMAPMRYMQNEMFGDLRKKTRNGFFDKLNSSAPYNLMLKLSTLHQKTQLGNGLYWPKEMALRFADAISSIYVRRAALLAEAQKIAVTPFHKLSKEFKGPEFDKMMELMHIATSNSVNLAQPLTHPDNKHIKKTGSKFSNIRAIHAKHHAEFLALPPKLQTMWHTAAKYYRDTQDTLALAMLNNQIAVVLGKADKQFAERVFNGTMTEADKDVFLTNTAMRAIAQAKDLTKIKGVYFPLMRQGNHVVTGYYRLPKIYSKNRIRKDEGRYGFSTVKEREAFEADMRERGLTITNTKTYSVEAATGKKYYTYTDPVTGILHKDPKNPTLARQYRFSKGDTGTREVFEVTVQNKVMILKDTKGQAMREAEELRKDGHYKINGVERREELTHSGARATTGQMRHVFKTLDQDPRFKDSGIAQKNLIRQAMHELSLSFLASTSPQNRARLRRNVLGASKDAVRNMAEYASVSSGAIANAELQPEVAEALNALEEHHKNRKDQTDSIVYPRSQILAEFRNAAQTQEVRPAWYNRGLNFMLTLSFLKHLASPMFHMLNGLQPTMIGAPYLAGRHGVVKSIAAISRAYRSIGFIDILGSGLSDTKKAVTDFMEGGTDYMANMETHLAKEPDGANLIKMMHRLFETGRISKDAGFEVNELINSKSMIEHGVQRMDHIARQFGIAVETLNRSAMAVSAFRLEFAKTGSFDEAMHYAQDAVVNTQGDYSFSNSAAMFKHPVGRLLLQFKKYPQLMYSLLGKFTYAAFKGATRAERIQGGKQLGYLLSTHVAMAGLLGLPTEPIKMFLMAFGLVFPLPQWEEIERGATQLSKDLLGDNLGDALVHGLPRLAGADVHSRVGMNSAWTFGEPQKDDEAHIKSWMWDTIGGPVIGQTGDWIEGIQAAENGDWSKAGSLIAPLKILADMAKAGKGVSEGEIATPAMRLLGLKSAAQARAEENKSAYFAEASKRKEMRQDLIDAWKAASGKERGEVQRLITKFNKGVPKDAKITGAVLARSLKREKSDKKKGYVKKGVYGGKANKDLLEQYLGE